MTSPNPSVPTEPGWYWWKTKCCDGEWLCVESGLCCGRCAIQRVANDRARGLTGEGDCALFVALNVGYGQMNRFVVEPHVTQSGTDSGIQDADAQQA